MPFTSTRAKLSLTDEDKVWLQQLSVSRSESVARVQRAQILLRYYQGQTVSAIAAELHSNRPKVERCIRKALELGVRAALKDLPGRGRPVSMTDEDKAWVVSLACQKPKDLGYAQELWNTRLLAKHIRKHCLEAGYPNLRKLAKGTVSKILAAHPIRPHKIRYYLERRDPYFEAKMIEVLHIYKDVELWRKTGLPSEVVGVLSYDPKNGS
jgi:transposase